MESSSSIRRTSLSDLFITVPINQKLNIESYFVLQEKVPDKQSSSYSETLLGLRENATGEPEALQTLQTLQILQLYAATIVSISKLRNSSFDTRLKLDLTSLHLGSVHILIWHSSRRLNDFCCRTPQSAVSPSQTLIRNVELDGGPGGSVAT